MMTPLQYETMMIVPLTHPQRLTLHKSHDIVRCVAICWATKYHMRNSPFEAIDYFVQTIGLDGVE